MSQLANEALSRWSGNTPYWEKHRELIQHMFAPVTKALLDDAEIKSGDAVLDVATGAGDPALSVAEEVGPSGKVIGIDPVPGMIESAGTYTGRLPSFASVKAGVVTRFKSRKPYWLMPRA